jgi:TonB-linked SusC/RagA family outer membrane protein
MQKTKQRVSLVALFLTLFVFCSAYAQQKTISGVVSEANNGEPVIGATVTIKNTSAGAATDTDGKFTLVVPANGTTLVVSYIGFLTQEIPIDKEYFEIAMRENATDLDELVVIGYGSVKKRDLTGSVSAIKGDALIQVPVANAAEAITGRLAGVRVTTVDGSPDADIMIRVRGGGSITQDNSPLYIVDGFTVSSIRDIPANDIEDITVLRDASSAAIYGSRGANGVILVTTKRPQVGKAKVQYNGYMQTKRLSKRLDVLNPYEYAKYSYEYAAISGESEITNYNRKFGDYGDMDLYKYMAGTDWQDDMFGGNSVSQYHNISISSGTDKTKYSVNGTYVKDNGLMPYSDFRRMNLDFKLDQELSKTLYFTFNGRASDTETNGSGTNGINTRDVLSRGPVKGLEDLIDVDPNSFATEEEREQWIKANMSMEDQALQNWRRRNSRRFQYDAALNWNIVKGLTYRLEGSYTLGFNEDRRYRGYITTDAINNGGEPLIIWSKSNANGWKLLNQLIYDFSLSESHFNVMAAQELLSDGGDNNQVQVLGFSKDLLPEKTFANLRLGDGGTSASSGVSEPTRLASFFGRINYTWRDRYLATVTFRADGSSKFRLGNQWGYFPSAALAWRINEESFMENTSEWLSNLKLRASYGEAGNNRVSSGLYKLNYNLSSSGTYALGDRGQNFHYVPVNSQLPNPDIKWESMVTRNGGLDFGLFDQRLSGTLEYYMNTTKNLLLDVNIVAPGYSRMVQNIGQTTNKGLELTLNALIVNKKKFSLAADFNISFNKSNVDALDSDDNVLLYSTNWASTDLKGLYEYEIRVGKPMGLVYGWICDGYYTTADFEQYDETAKRYILKEGVPNTALTAGRIGIRPGTIKFRDLSGPNGVPDGVIDDHDRTVIGDTNPKYFGGFGFNGTFFEHFDYTIYFSYVVGNDIYNTGRLAGAQQYRTSWPNLLGFMDSDHRYTYLADDGTVVTDLATLAAMNEGANAKEYWSPLSFGNSNAVIHSWAIEDGSFLRLQNVTLGYTLPKKLSGKFAAERLRVYCTVNNAWIATNYSGYDPELASAQTTPGVDNSKYPKSFSWTCGLNVTF